MRIKVKVLIPATFALMCASGGARGVHAYRRIRFAGHHRL